jgi:hypothetical protein
MVPGPGCAGGLPDLLGLPGLQKRPDFHAKSKGVTEKMGGRGSGRKPVGEEAMSSAEKQRRYRSRKLAGAPTKMTANRELRFGEALRSTLPPVKPEPPRWFKGKAPLEIVKGKKSYFA